MEQNFIPCYKYPTETIIIDDNKNFLKTLQFAIGKRQKCLPHEDPKKAIDYVANSLRRYETAINKFITAGEDSADLKKSMIVDFQDIYKTIYNKDRFKEVAVVVVDYAMPTMNGIEVAEQIRALTKNPIKVIMLTGEAGYDLAVKAFNKGDIDKFILKAQEQYVDDVVAAISSLQQKYFYDLSQPIRRSLQPEVQKLLEDREFISIFNKILEENKITEFYIVDDSLSFLFLDDKAENLIHLVVRSEEDFQTQYELASDDKTISTDIVNDLKNRKKLAYFKNEKGINQQVKDWIFTEAKPLNKNFYYAIIKGKDSFPLLNQEKKFTYQDYLKQK